MLAACGGAGSTARAYPDAPSRADLALSTGFASLDGVAPRGYFGNSVSSPGDLTGDGHADLLVTAPGTAIDNGIAYLFAGPLAAGRGSAGAAYATLVGLAPLQTAGGPQVGHADLNGDGLDDLVVGGPGQDVQSGGGKVYVFFGPIAPGTHPVETADVTLRGRTGDEYGDYGVVAADFDGDGIDDLAIGAEGRRGDSGAVDIYLGPLHAGSTPALELAGGEVAATFGRHLTAGELDGDGAPDLIVTAELSARGGANAGADYVFRGAALRVALTQHKAQISDASAAAVLLGGAEDLASTTAIADLNADGFADILVGAPDYFVGRRGKVYVLMGGPQPFAGAISLPQRALILAGERDGDLNGWLVANAGDLDGDGFDDALASAICHGTEAPCNPDTSPMGSLLRDFGPGAVYVLYSGRVPASGVHDIGAFAQRLTGTEAGETSGFTMGEGADVTGDGIPDVLIGAYCAPPLCTGRAYVVSGAQLR